jgi:hypothetical protein
MSDLLNQASLVMIPSGYKEDILYSEIPTDGSGDMAFTRASNGTRINSAGLVEVVAWNLAQQSETFNSVTWSKANTTITANDTTAPNGTTTADKFAPNGTLTSTYFSISQEVVSGATSQAHTAIIYAKAGGLTQMLMYLGNSIGVYWNLSNGQFISYYSGAQTITNYSSEAVGDGWYKYTISISTNSGSTYLEVYGAKSGAFIGNYTTADNCYIWGAQLNIGSTAKPYFPTTDRLNVPRLTYQNGGGGCPSLLLEKQSTNLLKYSEQFDESYWTKAQGNGGSLPIITANYGVSPDGTQNADRIQLTRTTQTSSFSYVYQTYSGTIGVAYTWSVWLKSLSGTPSVALSYDGSSYVNIVTLTTEWQRYTFTSNAIGTDLQATFLLFQNLSGTSLSADFLAWGAQLEASSYPTSYIPSTSSSATRVADACFKTGISSLIGQTEGTLFFEGSQIGAATSVPFQLSDTTNANRVQIEIQNTGAPLLVASSGGVNVAVIIGSSYTIGQNRKIAVTYKNNDFRLYQNGVLIGSDTSGSVPLSLTAMYLGAEITTPYPNLEIKQIVNFKTSLSDAECIALTTL